MKAIPTVAIDFRWFDHMAGGGQYRYGVDLVRGIAEIAPEMKFVVLGTREQSVEEMRTVFDGERWRYVQVPRIEGRGKLYREMARYRGLLREWKADVLHSLHSFVPVAPGVPVVETVHDMMLEIFPEYAGVVRSREYRVHRWAFRKWVTRAIAISEATARDLERLWHWHREKTDVIYHGQKFGAVPDLGAKDRIVISPYNLEPRKNLLALLRAMVSVPSVELVLFGRAAVNEARERAFEAEVARLGVGGRVRLTGFLSDEDLGQLYGRAAVFAFPSLYEGFGLPVLEAMAAGCCVIAQRESAMPEVVGDAGMLIDMREERELASALKLCFGDDGLRGRLAEKARGRAREFTRERMAKATLECYRKAMDRREERVDSKDMAGRQ
jgi:glycosyltransferase involved in cell wall biosynthesis